MRGARGWALWLCLGVVVVLGGCGDEEETPAPQPPPTPAAVLKAPFEAPPYALYLKEMKICLDPGHGGRASRKGYKRGPTGLREAEVNLRVAHFLREFLEASGAKVLMTRRTDVYLAADDREDQRRRIKMANDNKCDLFLSIHHNANDNNPKANFTSVWYHGGVHDSPASLDVAWCIAVAMSDELRLPQQLGCPVLSDELMYPRSGFAVLRQARVPAVLCEGSFHSNPEEEQRLRDPEYNRREAYAMFVGLARYAYGGIPRASLVEPAGGVVTTSGPKEVVIELDDGISGRKSWGWDRPMILRDSIVVRLGAQELPFVYEEKDRRVCLQLPDKLQLGSLRLNVQFENLFKHSNTRPYIDLKVARKTAASTRPAPQPR